MQGADICSQPRAGCNGSDQSRAVVIGFAQVCQTAEKSLATISDALARYVGRVLTLCLIVSLQRSFTSSTLCWFINVAVQSVAQPRSNVKSRAILELEGRTGCIWTTVADGKGGQHQAAEEVSPHVSKFLQKRV